MEQLKFLLSILNISNYVGVLSIISFFIFYSKLNRNEKWIAQVLFLFVLLDIVATMLVFFRMENLWYYNWALLPQAMLVTYGFAKEMNKKNVKRNLVIGSLILSCLHIINLLFFQGFHVLANFTYIPTYGWMSVMAFYFLKEQFEAVDLIPFNFLITWFAVATLIDVAGSLPILSVLGWSGFISQAVFYHLYDLVIWLYTLWFLIILTGLLWTKTTIRSAFYFQ